MIQDIALLDEIINNSLQLNKQLKKLESFFEFDSTNNECPKKSYNQILENIAIINHYNYRTAKSLRKILLERNKILKTVVSSNGEMIMCNALRINANLKTVYKALLHDEDMIDNFLNDYQYILEDSIKINWQTHEIGEDVSHQEFKQFMANRRLS